MIQHYFLQISAESNQKTHQNEKRKFKNKGIYWKLANRKISNFVGAKPGISSRAVVSKAMLQYAESRISGNSWSESHLAKVMYRNQYFAVSRHMQGQRPSKQAGCIVTVLDHHFDTGGFQVDYVPGFPHNSVPKHCNSVRNTTTRSDLVHILTGYEPWQSPFLLLLNSGQEHGTFLFQNKANCHGF